MSVYPNLAPQIPLNESAIHKGDAFSLIERIPEASIDLVVTSPPYNISKSYERGMFGSLDDYKNSMEEFVGVLATKLKDTGSICWQVGSYVKNGRVTPLDFLFYEIFLKKDFILRNRIIWRFNFGFNAKHRFSGRYETLLWFTKTDDYTFNLDPIRVPQLYPGKAKKTADGYQPSGNPKGKTRLTFGSLRLQTHFLASLFGTFLM